MDRASPASPPARRRATPAGLSHSGRGRLRAPFRLTGRMLLLATLLAGLPLSTLLAQIEGDPVAGRSSLAVLDLEAVGAEPGEASAVSDRLREALLDSGRFELVDAGSFAAAEDAQRRSGGGCEGMACSFGAARSLGVERVVTGRLSRLGEGAWQVSAQLLDVAAERTERAESVVHEGRFVGLLTDAVPRLAAKLSGGGQPDPAAAPSALRATEEPRETQPTMVRFFGALLDGQTFTFTVETDDGEREETWGGGAIGLGLDVIVDQSVAFWGAVHGGTLSSVEASGGGQGSQSSENVEGDFVTVTAGVSIVAENHPWRALIGAGLFHTDATLERVGDTKVDRKLEVTGLLFDARLDYTFESDWYVGGALAVGGGSASGSATDEGKDPGGSIVMFYVPVGLSF